VRPATREERLAADEDGEDLENLYQLYNALAFDVYTTLLDN
jgi:hypothetical protein